MQIQITLGDNDTRQQVQDLVDALSQVWGLSNPVALAAAGRRLRNPPDDEPNAAPPSEALLAKLEAENPQFGKQPLPEGATSAEGARPLAPPSPPSAPSPAVAAPSMSAPAAAPGSSAEVDKNGFPWDERIHASSRAKIADGSWRMKRGVDPFKVTEVEAQLRVGSGPMTIRTIPVTGGEPDAPPAPPGPPAPPAAPVAGAGLTFGQLAKRVGARITLGELTAQDLGTQMAALGFPGGLHEANSRPDMWATILETLGA
jgi:hypothetical protein